MKKSIISFIAVIAAISVLGVFAVSGLNVMGRTIIPSVFDADKGIRRGLDLVGGSSITFEADLPENYNTADLTSDMETVQTLLRQRLDAENYTEATVALQGDRRIVVEIPGIKNPEDAVTALGKTAQLKFTDADGNLIMDGSAIDKAEYSYGPVTQGGLDEHYVTVTFKKDAVSTWTEATKNAANQTSGKNIINIMLDDQTVSSPSVSSEYAGTGLTGNTCVISGSFTAASAKQLADYINIGQLPFSLKQDELRAVGAQLGSNALRSSFYAGMIGIALVAIFMIIMYRLPGFVSVIALGFYMVIEALLLVAFKVNLTLPGIAGIILTIGMAVDANVIIFERIKEELRAGKTVKASIDSGFKRAFTAILDSNVTTLIAAIVLYWQGTGTIISFAMTLGMGVVISMFTALTVTHFLLNRMVDFRIKNPKAYGA